MRITLVLDLPRREDGMVEIGLLTALMRGLNRPRITGTWALSVDGTFRDGQGIDPEELITGIPTKGEARDYAGSVAPNGGAQRRDGHHQKRGADDS